MLLANSHQIFQIRVLLKFTGFPGGERMSEWGGSVDDGVFFTWNYNLNILVKLLIFKTILRLLWDIVLNKFPFLYSHSIF